MISSDGVNLLNFVGERCRLVDQQLYEIMRGRFSCQKLKLLVDGTSPRDTDTETDLEESQVQGRQRQEWRDLQLLLQWDRGLYK
jgi:hypothetical protein